jgi:uncharacterized protein YndB with AHSA1/START domain
MTDPTGADVPSGAPAGAPSGAPDAPGPSGAAPVRGFTLRRTVAAPRDVVWAAWTDPDRLGWVAGDARGVDRDLEASIDLRVGGAWRVRLTEGEGSGRQLVTGGIYRRVEPRERLEFAWGAVGGWPELDPGEGLAALEAVPQVVVTFEDAHDGARPVTVLTVHVGFTAAVPGAEVERWLGMGIQSGWSDTLDRLRPPPA